MPRHLLLQLEAPLLAFGGETIDNYGVIRDFPALSMVTGLLANALGWRREETERHEQLQNRMKMGARLDGCSMRIRDFQTAQIALEDTAWTTRGIPEGRAGGTNTYKNPHLRFRDYHTNLSTLVALRLEPAGESPTLDNLAQALDHPARPLFIGRKPCLPNRRIYAGWQESDNMLQALQTAPCLDAGVERMRLQWPDGEGELPGSHVLDLCDERNWTSGVHGGWRPVREGTIQPDEVQI